MPASGDQPPVGAAGVVAAALRAQILDGALEGGTALREVALTREHGVARHTLRAALRSLAAEGLVSIERNRGARVALLDDDAVRGLHELRLVLETGAVRLALERHGGRLPAVVHEAAGAFAALCRAPLALSVASVASSGAGSTLSEGVGPRWADVVVAHAELHATLVAAAGSPRISQAHAALQGELRLFLIRGRPRFGLEHLAQDHLALVAGIEEEGTPALERHLAASATAVAGAQQPGGRAGGPGSEGDAFAQARHSA